MIPNINTISTKKFLGISFFFSGLWVAGHVPGTPHWIQIHHRRLGQPCEQTSNTATTHKVEHAQLYPLVAASSVHQSLVLTRHKVEKYVSISEKNWMDENPKMIAVHSLGVN